MEHQHKHNEQGKESISLISVVVMGTGVVIGADIFALIGQLSELLGNVYDG
tara:strand:- start:370 stop:522 length:153 start_codon:yes stop_codon:yes gene_type:complete